MAISKIVYKSSPSAAPETWMDATPATAAAADIAAPKTAMLANGVVTEGTGSGGGDTNPVAPEKLVNFIDYDGAIRYSYTAAEFAELTELPANPTHEGRVAQGWNWTLAQIQAQIAESTKAPIWVGQKYTSIDGATHFRIVISDGTPSNRMTFYVRYTQSTSYGVTVDWGDGSAPESYSSSGSNLAHTPANAGEYDVALSVNSGTVSFIGSEYSSSIYGPQASKYLSGRFKDIIFGDDVAGIGAYTFYEWYGCPSIYIPAVAGDANYALGYADGLSTIIFGDAVTALPQNFCRYCPALKRVSLPGGLTSIGYRSLSVCGSLKDVTISSTVTSIGELAFTECTSLTNLVIPASVTSIGDSAFSGCTGMGAYHIRATTPPTLGSSAFSGIPSDCVIYVPQGSGSAYRSASGWSAYASQIQEEAS